MGSGSGVTLWLCDSVTLWLCHSVTLCAINGLISLLPFIRLGRNFFLCPFFAKLLKNFQIGPFWADWQTLYFSKRPAIYLWKRLATTLPVINIARGLKFATQISPLLNYLIYGWHLNGDMNWRATWCGTLISCIDLSKYKCHRTRLDNIF
jgi:hypothetical protein